VVGVQTRENENEGKRNKKGFTKQSEEKKRKQSEANGVSFESTSAEAPHYRLYL